MRRIISAVAASAAFAMGAFMIPSAAIAADGAVPTFTKDVAPIFYKSCVECHRATMFAPMSLMTYEDARPWTRAIKQRVTARTMPPWGAPDAPHGVFKNDPRLTDREIETIAAWIDGGAPRGAESDMPKAPAFADGWTIGKPDAVFAMSEEFKIPATGTIPYQYVRIPVDLPDDRWIQAYEIKPGARAHVHHVIAFTQASGEAVKPGDALGPTNIGGVTPNKPGVVFEPGIARLLKGHSDVILQIHYTTNGTEAVDKTELGIIFAKEPPKKLAAGGLALNPTFVIPAGAENHEVRAVRAVARDTMLVSMTPHMHVRGKDMTYIAHYADGTSETLLSVPRYDFNWQITYQLAEPKLIPKGTQIEVIAHYDNSAGNKFNPDPAKDVRWGDQTWEEMMIGFWGTLADVPEAVGTKAPLR